MLKFNKVLSLFLLSAASVALVGCSATSDDPTNDNNQGDTSGGNTDTPNTEGDTPTTGDTPSGDGDTPSGDGDTPSGDGDTPSGDGDTPTTDGDTTTTGDTPTGDDTKEPDKSGELTGGGTGSGSTSGTISGTTLVKGAVTILNVAGSNESGYATWSKVSGASSYKVYYKETSASKYVEVDDMLIRDYGTYVRCDILGLTAGNYNMRIVPVASNGTEGSATTTKFTATQHSREGFGFVEGTSSGAYNDNGTLRTGAVKLYVTNENKDTVSLDVVTNNKGATTNCVGLSAILAAFKKGCDTRGLSVRLIGNITDLAVMDKGDIVVDGCTNGVTIEGVGDDAVANGWGLRIKGSSNVEVRNIAFMNCNSGEGDDVGLQQDNDHCWIHNCDFFYGDAGGDSDQAKGDGALDTKKSTYITHSYNHFWDTGKSNLQGMTSEKTTNYITYHHNWYDHSDSRHPRVRTCTVHAYNNYFDGIAKYGIGVTLGASLFSEENYFRNVKNPLLSSKQGTDALGEGTFSGEDGGIIKSYNDIMTGSYSLIDQHESATSFDAYIATSRDEKVSSSYKTLSGGTIYNNFDTSSGFYSYSPDKAQDVPAKVEQTAGRVDGGDFEFEFDDSVDDTSYAVNTALKSLLTNYKSDLVNVLGDDYLGSSTDTLHEFQTATVAQTVEAIDSIGTIAYTSESLELIQIAQGYYNDLSATDKNLVTNYSVLVSAISQYSELKVNDVKSTIDAIGEVDANSGSKITLARSKYDSLDEEEKLLVTNYSTLTQAETTYTSFAVESCINKINALGTITLASKDAIAEARNEYNGLSDAQKASVTNYATLTSSEEQYNQLVKIANVEELIDGANDLTSMKNAINAYDALTESEKALVSNASDMTEIKVNYTVSLINSIGTVTSASATNIVQAEEMYASLSDTEKASVTNYATLTSAREELDVILAQALSVTFLNGVSSDASVVVSGNKSTETATIDGVSYTGGLKMETNTSVTFTTSVTKTLTLHVTAGKKIKVDGVDYTASAEGLVVIENFAAGSHTIAKNTSSTTLFALILE